MSISVLVVDDHHLFRRGVIGILKTVEDIEVVGEASNGEEAIRVVKQLQPDVLIMDLCMPVMSGIEVIRHFQDLVVATRVLILTVNEEERSLYEAVKYGAQGYAIKSIDPDDLIDAIRRVASGEAVIPSNLAIKMMFEVSNLGSSAAPLIESLTSREIEVLQELGLGLSNRDIARRLYISENTVRNHVRNILDKLHMSNRVQAAAYAVREGIVQGNETL
ncbi:response regulator transcription factor [Paenibacillus sp.]|jgi:two-component system NarL family response regulator|uniref:response regulator transcription factor n=1 Tax=Paenibacillus sp. TaxID=58172 RepID=UPI00282FD8FF|nr:response regulator transcription factor [Paenibacillus sp.]MDR0266944.1 response regulator transcription factor [Paenibacillus sp.]